MSLMRGVFRQLFAIAYLCVIALGCNKQPDNTFAGLIFFSNCLAQETCVAGARVRAIVPSSPAQRSGIQRLDLIVGLNGKSISSPSAFVGELRITSTPCVLVNIRRRNDPLDFEMCFSNDRQHEQWSKEAMSDFADSTAPVAELKGSVAHPGLYDLVDKDLFWALENAKPFGEKICLMVTGPSHERGGSTCSERKAVKWKAGTSVSTTVEPRESRCDVLWNIPLSDIELVQIASMFDRLSVVFESSGVPMEAAFAGMTVGRECKKMRTIDTKSNCVEFEGGFQKCLKQEFGEPRK
jgi:hypothetical protein